MTKIKIPELEFEMEETAQDVLRMMTEASSSLEKYGSYRSPHEAYGVLAEEMSEMLDAIHKNDDESARHEALQIAAVAFRFATEGWTRT